MRAPLNGAKGVGALQYGSGIKSHQGLAVAVSVADTESSTRLLDVLSTLSSRQSGAKSEPVFGGFRVLDYA